jgi:hypothetical protein
MIGLTYLVLLLAALAGPSSASKQVSNDYWIITRIGTVSSGANGKYVTTVTYSRMDGSHKIGASQQVVFQSAFKYIKQNYIFGNHAVIIGDSGYYGYVVILDLQDQQVIDRIIGYSPELLGNRWLVFVEWYPNHLFAQYPIDVVLLYDLQLSPSENRKEPGTKSIESIDWMTKAGTPVYPEKNLVNGLYKNVTNDISDTWKVITDTFVLLPGNRLVFVGARGEQFTEQTRFLVMIELNDIKTQKKLTVESISVDDLGIHGNSNEPIVITGLQVVNDSKVRISFPKNRYDKDSVIIQLPAALQH